MADPVKPPKCTSLLEWLREATEQDIENTGTSEGMLRQIAHRRRPASAKRAVLIESASGGRVTRQDLCPNDWPEIWPELAA